MKTVKTMRWHQDQSGAAGTQIGQVQGNVYICQCAAPDCAARLGVKGNGSVGIMGDHNTVNINMPLLEGLCALLEQIAGQMQLQHDHMRGRKR